MRKPKCNEDCFNCVHDDCIVDVLSSKDRKEITERDKRYFNSGTVSLQARPRKRKYRGGHGFSIG